MDRIFRIKYMRLMAVLTAVAVIAGNVSTSMLYVQAAPGYESDEGYYGDTNDGDWDDEGCGIVSVDDIDDEDKTGIETEADEILNEEGTAVELIEADGLVGEEEEAAKTRVTISGNIEDKKYDGEMYDISGKLKVTVVETDSSESQEEEKREEEVTEETADTETQTEKDVTEDVKKNLTYTFSGEKANGEQYPSDGGTTEEAPKDAGTYTVVVAVSEDDENYEGRQEFSFKITKRSLIITPYYDGTLTVGDEMPDKYEYEVAGDKFVDGESFDTLGNAPIITCTTDNTDVAGEYTLTAKGANAGNNYEISYREGTLTVSEPETEPEPEPEPEPKAKLIRIISPDAVRNVPSGTLLKDMPLPETVQIVIENLAAKEDDLEEIKVPAEVNWVLSPIDGTSYNPSRSAEQIFILGGTVVLPDNVELPEDAEENGLTLDVKIEVHVRENLESNVAVSAPTADPASGSTLPKGTKVTLSCETEGAVIYYTLNGTEPTRQSNRYSAPIEVSGDTVIRAFAAKTGYPDSAVVKFSYFVFTGSSSGGEDSEPEVPKEDIPSNGVIPSGLWTPEIKGEFVYTGKAIKPEVKLYDYKTRLTENKDYTVAYKNNVNAADANAAKAPTITITGKGNYEGKITKTFTIAPKKISDSDVSIDDITVAYNKKAQKPSPTVMWSGKKLTNKKDYTVQDVSFTDAGSRTITVTGCGNYTGAKTFLFTITEDIPVSKLTIGKIANQTYTGEQITPTLTVKYKGELLSLNQNYRVTYRNNVEVGTATAIIEGIDRYVGTRKVTFKIKEVASLSKAKIDVQFDSTPTYTGRSITADRVNVTINLKDENGQNVETTLVEYKDYTVSYQKNDKVGTAAIVITGKGAYGGTVKKTFKIVAYDMQNTSVRISLNGSYPYMKGGIKPEPYVMFSGIKLELGKDYTLSYKKNNAVGSEAAVTVKGKGNFKGSVTKSFTITPQNIGSMTVDAADKVYQNKKNIYKTTVRLTDINGKALKAGTDYDKNMEYTYAADTNVKIKNADTEDAISRKKGAAVEKDDIIPGGTTINVTIRAVGNNYAGSVSGTYRIVDANISGAKVTIPAQTYTGKEIKPTSGIQVVLKGQTLSEDRDYTIVGYSNNINKGTAKIVIRGIGNYGGTKTATFKIKGKGLFN